MKTYRRFFQLILLYIAGYILSMGIYIIYANHFINPRLSKEIDKMIFAKYTFLDPDSARVNIKESFKGKIRLIDFWTLNCSFCTDDLNKFYELNLQKNDEFLILAINNDVFQKWDSYLRENQLIDKHPQIRHFNISDRTILSKLEVEYYPTYFLLDEEGMIRSRCSYNFVLTRINRVLNNKMYFKDYLHEIYKYFPCGGLGRPTLAYTFVVFPVLLVAYYFFYWKRKK